MSALSLPTDMAFFSLLARHASLASAAREMGVSAPAVSKRLAHMEARLQVPLVMRTTRRMLLTPEGETYLLHARRILAEIDDMERLVSQAMRVPQGLLRVNATLGFGRNHIAPLLSTFRQQYPGIEVQLQLTVEQPALDEDAFDVSVRFGEPPDARVLARRIAHNRRLLCASPAYLAEHGEPEVPEDLTRHACIDIRHSDQTHGLWRLSLGRRTHAIKVNVQMSTNDGEIAVSWAIDGHGIALRSDWDIARYLENGQLKQVLSRYRTPPADVYAVYPPRHQFNSRVRVFVDFLQASFGAAAHDRLVSRDPSATPTATAGITPGAAARSTPSARRPPAGSRR